MDPLPLSHQGLLIRAEDERLASTRSAGFRVWRLRPEPLGLELAGAAE